MATATLTTMTTAGRNDSPYRGLAADVAGMEVQQALEAAGLNWKTVQRPTLIQGLRENRPSRFLALIRSDSGYELGSSTKAYIPVHNEQLFTAMYRLAGEGGMRITKAGLIREGERVFASAELGATYDIPVDDSWLRRMERNPNHGWLTDTTKLVMVMQAGHIPGSAIDYSLQAERLICSNGAKITHGIGAMHCSHRGSSQNGTTFSLQIHNLMAVVEGALGGFRAYEQQMLTLRSAKARRTSDQHAMIIRAVQPKLWDILQWRANAAMTAASAPANSVGLYVATLAEMEKARSHGDYTGLLERTTQQCIQALDIQPGAGSAPNTLYESYQAITWVIDHVTGRSVDANVESALWGKGAGIKERALDTAMQMVPVLKEVLK